MGFATAAAAAAEGASVVVASSNAGRVATALEKLPDGSKGSVFDARSEDAARDFFEEVGDFDHLVYTAGRGPAPQDLQSFDLAKGRETVELSYWGVVGTVKHASPRIRAGGSVVLTSGGIGARPQKGWAVSAGIVGAIEGLTRGLAVELAPLRVNAVAPGIVRTEMWQTMPAAELEALFGALGEGLLTGRVGDPEDIAEANLSLMRNPFVTGIVVPVDGGGRLV